MSPPRPRRVDDHGGAPAPEVGLRDEPARLAAAAAAARDAPPRRRHDAGERLRVKGAGLLRQRADYTHRFNSARGRHGWLRLTPSYSIKIVDEILSRHSSGKRVLDPFCGSGTTALAAASRGHSVHTIDINPFLVWLARAKTARYTARELAEAGGAGRSAARAARLGKSPESADPPMHNIGRWWPDRARFFLRHLKSAIQGSPTRSARATDLLNVAFCRTLIGLSSASFGHQSMSFDSGRGAPGALPAMEKAFMDDLDAVIRSSKGGIRGRASVVCGDSRDMGACTPPGFDVVVTSPPYANRMSYIREMRPYMYWLGYLTSGRDAGELDWSAIGGTWGIAASRLSQWSPSGRCWLPTDLLGTIDSVRDADAKSGAVLAAYIERYFGDISAHLASLRGALRRNASVHYIIGNSSFYGTLIPSEQIYASLMKKHGFEGVSVRPVRKRNSKKELVEFEVSAR